MLRTRKSHFVSMNDNKMKPKRTQRHTGANWQQGKDGNMSEKRTPGQAKRTSLGCSASQMKHFAGKIFYLDLPSNRTAEILERDIKQLGGIVEKFFSKEIKYLISNKREAKYVHCLRQDSPVPIPDSRQSSPHPFSNMHTTGSHVDIKSPSQGQTDTFVTCQGKSLVEKEVKEQERVQMNKILSNALEWGVKIFYIDEFLAYIQKKKKSISQAHVIAAVKTKVKPDAKRKQGFQKCRGGQISRPFIKVEDSSRHYRPIYLTMPNLPKFNLKTVAPFSPFHLVDKNPPENKQREYRGMKPTASEEKVCSRKNRHKKQGGYCECCMIKYDKLKMHLQGERHKAFVKSDEYFVVDRLISTLNYNFICNRTKAKRPKCSVSSVVTAPGPCRKNDLKGNVDVSEIVKEEEFLTIKDKEGLQSELHKNIRSAPDSAELTQRGGCQRTRFTYSNRSKHKSVTSKQTCRQNTSTWKQKSERPQIPQFKSKTIPTGSGFLPSLLSQVSEVDHIDQMPHKNSKSSTSHFDNQKTEDEIVPESISVMTHKPEETDMNKDPLPFEANENGKVSHEKATFKNPSEKEKEGVPIESIFPVRKIQRKIRVYKHKRQRLDISVNQVNSSDVPEKSILKLWELFQSSDDMDVEFYGFEN
ncbi:protein DBF4 homolog A isoform 1-T2 [Pholidichthys leucotaenia]